LLESTGKLFKNRSGAVIAGVIVAVIAVILLVFYLRSYRSSVNSGKQPERVLVATKNIAAGTSGTLIAKQGLYTVTSVQKDQLQLNAITDPAALAGRVAAADIFPGQQLTQEDFSTEAPQSIPYQITGQQRAIAVTVSSNHGLVGQVTAGDTVDVYVATSGPGGTSKAGTGLPSGQLVKLLQPDVYVLVAPGTDSPNAVLRISTKDAAKFAFASDNAALWLVLRPAAGASRTPPSTATLATLLAGA
jgi:Flp pilus assembly protein CpaB